MKESFILRSQNVVENKKWITVVDEKLWCAAVKAHRDCVTQLLAPQVYWLPSLNGDHFDQSEC